MSLVIIQPGEVGVVMDQTSGEILPPLLPGTHLVPWSRTVVRFPIIQQEYTMAAPDDAIEAYTADGQLVALDITVTFTVDRARVNDLFIRWGDTYADNFVRPTLRSATRDVVALYTARQLYGAERAQMEAQLTDILTQQFKNEGLVLVRDIRFSTELADILEAEAAATQNAAGTATPTPSP